jgi:hypothetical protein
MFYLGASLTKCQRHHQRVLRASDPSSYIPRCTPEGRYVKKQCWGAECFCVDQSGRRIDGTSVRISEGEPDCVTKCKFNKHYDTWNISLKSFP